MRQTALTDVVNLLDVANVGAPSGYEWDATITGSTVAAYHLVEGDPTRDALASLVEFSGTWIWAAHADSRINTTVTYVDPLRGMLAGNLQLSGVTLR